MMKRKNFSEFIQFQSQKNKKNSEGENLKKWKAKKVHFKQFHQQNLWSLQFLSKAVVIDGKIKKLFSIDEKFIFNYFWYEKWTWSKREKLVLMPILSFFFIFKATQYFSLRFLIEIANIFANLNRYFQFFILKFLLNFCNLAAF